MQKARRAATGGAAHGHQGRQNARNDEKRTKPDLVNRINSDQIKPNPTKKNGLARIKARAVGSGLPRANLGFGRAGWMRGNAERMNGNARCLSDRNIFFTCFAYERGSGLAENPRLSSLILAYSRLCSLIFAYLRLMGEK
jgi:hypothetical protein